MLEAEDAARAVGGAAPVAKGAAPAVKGAPTTKGRATKLAKTPTVARPQAAVKTGGVPPLRETRGMKKLRFNVEPAQSQSEEEMQASRARKVSLFPISCFVQTCTKC